MLLAGRVTGDQIGVAQLAGQSGLPSETFEELGILFGAIAEDLESEELPLGILHLVNPAHRALAQAFAHQIAEKAFAEQGIGACRLAARAHPLPAVRTGDLGRHPVPRQQEPLPAGRAPEFLDHLGRIVGHVHLRLRRLPPGKGSATMVWSRAPLPSLSKLPQP